MDTWNFEKRSVGLNGNNNLDSAGRLTGNFGMYKEKVKRNILNDNTAFG